MSNTIINWRFGSYHLQVVRLGDWRSEIKMGRSPITWRHNPYHDSPEVRNAEGWSWIKLDR